VIEQKKLIGFLVSLCLLPIYLHTAEFPAAFTPAVSYGPGTSGAMHPTGHPYLYSALPTSYSVCYGPGAAAPAYLSYAPAGLPHGHGTGWHGDSMAGSQPPHDSRAAKSPGRLSNHDKILRLEALTAQLESQIKALQNQVMVTDLREEVRTLRTRVEKLEKQSTVDQAFIKGFAIGRYRDKNNFTNLLSLLCRYGIHVSYGDLAATAHQGPARLTGAEHAGQIRRSSISRSSHTPRALTPPPMHRSLTPPRVVTAILTRPATAAAAAAAGAPTPSAMAPAATPISTGPAAGTLQRRTMHRDGAKHHRPKMPTAATAVQTMAATGEKPVIAPSTAPAI
jgi:hypothetical protein